LHQELDHKIDLALSPEGQVLRIDAGSP
jgi:hypothetical protein